jgi:hypothetical protein
MRITSRGPGSLLLPARLGLLSVLLVAACDGGGPVAVAVADAQPDSIHVSPALASLEMGSTAQLSATVHDARGAPIADFPVTWSSNGESVATVTADGLVTATGAGTAAITARAGSISHSALLTVTRTVAAISILPAEWATELGASRPFAAVLYDRTGAAFTGPAVSWSSDDEAAARITPDGLVTAVGAGEATITARVGSVSRTAQLTIAPPTAGWQAMGTGMNDEVNAIVVYDGQVVAGGWFTTAGGTPVNFIARWDGSAWHPLGAGLNSPVMALTVHEGQLIAAGHFERAGGVPANYVARWDGHAWHAMGPGMSEYTNALVEHNGQLIAGGWSPTGGVDAKRIARWNGTEWLPMGTGANSPIWALAVVGNQLIAAGSFTLAGGVSANRVARWDGADWRPLGAGLNNHVQALAVHDGVLFAGGYFTDSGGQEVTRVARWDGGIWQPVGHDLEAGVLALAVYDDVLIAGGIFRSKANGIARWDGSHWQPLGGGVTGGGVQALAVHGNALIVGGYFVSAGGVQARHIARWGP